MTPVLPALAGSLALAAFPCLAPPLTRLPQRHRELLANFSAGTGLAYVLLYLLFELAKAGAPKIHALLPLGPEPLETLFILLLAAKSAHYLLQTQLEKTPGRRDDYLGYAGFFLIYNFLAGAGVVEEAQAAGLLNLAFYVVALGLHLLSNDLVLHHLDAGRRHRRWRRALATMPLAGYATAAGLGLPEGVLYGMLAVVGGSTIISVVRHELPHPGAFRPAAFLAGLALYALLILATWRF